MKQTINIFIFNLAETLIKVLNTEVFVAERFRSARRLSILS